MQTYRRRHDRPGRGGTLFDIVHKGSAKYFFANWRKSKSKGRKQVGGGELVSIAVKTGRRGRPDLRANSATRAAGSRTC